MKTSNIFKLFVGTIMAVSIQMVAVSCEDFSFPTDDSYARTFRPPVFAPADVKATEVTLEWTKVAGVKEYLIEISRDSLAFEQDLKAFTVANTEESFVIGDLFSDKRYSARIKAISATGLPDSEFNSLTFETPGEQIFTGKTISYDNVENKNLLRVHWEPGSVVTHIKLSYFGAEPVNIELTEEQKQVGEIDLLNLLADVDYTIEIYNTDESKRGVLTHKTFAQYPAGYQLVPDGADLNSYFAAGGDVVLVLPASSTFVLGKITLPDNLTSLTVWGEHIGTEAAFNTTTIALGLNTVSLSFRNLTVHGNSSGSDYVVNENKTTAFKSIHFEDCLIHTVRGIVRMQNTANATALENVSFNNCLIRDIGGFGLVNGATAGAPFRYKDISVTNSTIWNVSDIIMGIYTPILGNVKVADCTFYNTIGNGRYMFNFNNDVANWPQGSLAVERSVFGKFFFTTAAPDPLQSARFTNPFVDGVWVTGSYHTTDFQINPAYAFTAIESYAKTAADLFVAPSTGDFHFKDKTFAGASSSGDPRWRN